MTDERWDRLDALAAAATPGPWTAEKYEPYDDEWNEETYGWWVHGPEWAEGSGEFRNFTGPNAAFIAACDPATIRDLVAAARIGEEPTGYYRAEDVAAMLEAIYRLPRYAMVGAINDRHMDAAPDGNFVLLSDLRAALNREDGAL